MSDRKSIAWLQELLRTTPSLPSVNGENQIEALSVASKPVRNRSGASECGSSPAVGILEPQTQQWKAEQGHAKPPANGATQQQRANSAPHAVKGSGPGDEAAPAGTGAQKRGGSAQRHWLTWQPSPKPAPSESEDGWVDGMVTPSMGGHPYGHGKPQPSFEPALKSWITNASQYEKDVAYNLFTHLNTNLANAPQLGAAPARKSYPALKYKGQKGAILPQPLGGRGPMFKKYRAPTAGVRTRPLSEIGLDEEMINAQLSRLDEQQQYSPQPPSEPYGGARGASPAQKFFTYGQQGPVRRKRPDENGFVCEQSTFMNSQLPYRSHFIINPEWVSESKTMKKMAMSALKKRRSYSAKC